MTTIADPPAVEMASGGGDGEIREGLLCPICMQDWGSVDRLLQHFDEDHNTEDKDVIQSFKGAPWMLKNRGCIPIWICLHRFPRQSQEDLEGRQSGEGAFKSTMGRLGTPGAGGLEEPVD